MKHKKRTRVEFDFSGKRRESFDRLVKIICPARWGVGIDNFGFMNDTHRVLFSLCEIGAIGIDECEYSFGKPCPDTEASKRIMSMLGKRRSHQVLREMAALLGNEPFESSECYRNTIYLPDQKAFVRADGMEPEDIPDMFMADGCEKIIIFPFYPLDGKSAYYELKLLVVKESFVGYMNSAKEQRRESANDEVRLLIERYTTK